MCFTVLAIFFSFNLSHPRHMDILYNVHPVLPVLPLNSLVIITSLTSSIPDKISFKPSNNIVIIFHLIIYSKHIINLFLFLASNHWNQSVKWKYIFFHNYMEFVSIYPEFLQDNVIWKRFSGLSRSQCETFISFLQISNVSQY